MNSLQHSRVYLPGNNTQYTPKVSRVLQRYNINQNEPIN